MIKEYHLWRCRRLSRRLTYHQQIVGEITRLKEARKLNKRRK